MHSGKIPFTLLNNSNTVQFTREPSYKENEKVFVATSDFVQVDEPPEPIGDGDGS